MHKYSSPGVNEESLLERAEKYEVFKDECVEAGYPRPVGEGVLMWDEVKVSYCSVKILLI
jgi:hypothetical protein